MVRNSVTHAMWVNLTVGVRPDMAEKVREEANARGMNRNEYVRHLMREATSSPFDPPEDELPERLDIEEAQKGPSKPCLVSQGPHVTSERRGARR